MDKRAFKNFITKRSSIWTISLCMTGILVLGGIAAVDKTRRAKDEQQETEMGQVAYLEEEITESPDDIEESLFPTLAEGETEDIAQASGNNAVEDGTLQMQENGLDNMAAAEEGLIAGDSLEEKDGLAAEDEEASAGVAASVGDGENAGVVASVGTGEEAGEAAEEASADHVISEQVLLEQGIDFTEEDSLVWPSAGTILIDYSMDGSVYFPTLNQYKYNPALIISSETGNQVLSSAKGIVESVTVDEETGTTVVMNIGNGYKLTYGQLKELAVGEGDVVEAGALIGYVSEPTKYYSTEGSNLYFAMTHDGTAVDPVLFLE